MQALTIWLGILKDSYHPNKWLHLLLTGWSWHFCNSRHSALGRFVATCSICFPKESTSVFLYCNLSKFNCTLHPLAISSKVANARSWFLWFCCLPTFIMSSAMTITFSIIPKHWSSLCWNTSPATVAPNGLTVYLNLPISVFKVVKSDEASSNFWCQYHFLQSHAAIMQASASKSAMFSGILKWYGSLMIALFRLIGSKQIHSFKLPDLSLAYTSRKLMIQGDASCTSLSTPACNILQLIV